MGAKGKDIIEGGTGIDHLYGGNNSDDLDGGKNNDALFGGNGSDTLDGGIGKDAVSGGAGNDIVVVAPLADGEAFNGGGGTDLLDLSGIGVEIKISADGTIRVGSASAIMVQFEKIYAGGGNDRIADGDGNTIIRGNAGNDTLEGGLGDDSLEGGNGEDTATFASASSGVTVDLGIAGAQNTGVGNDTLKLIEHLTGSDFNDSLTGDGAANDFDGGRGNDTIKGGGGADLIVGNAGKDTIEGGGGADTFNYRKVSDSTGTKYDTLKGADFSADKWDIQGAVTGIDTAITTGQLRANNFNADMAAAVNGASLDPNHAVLFTASSGDLAGKTFLIIDRNGAPGYQAGGDIVILLQSPVGIGNLDPGDFI
jgi:Ca2+-binding RTX toxin-like protein